MTMHDLFDGSDHTLIEEAMSREQFERFMANGGASEEMLERKFDEYKLDTIQCAWCAWQASREVPIKLPKVKIPSFDMCDVGEAKGITACAEAIRAAGYQVEEAK